MGWLPFLFFFSFFCRKKFLSFFFFLSHILMIKNLQIYQEDRLVKEALSDTLIVHILEILLLSLFPESIESKFIMTLYLIFVHKQ